MGTLKPHRPSLRCARPRSLIGSDAWLLTRRCWFESSRGRWTGRRRCPPGPSARPEPARDVQTAKARPYRSGLRWRTNASRGERSCGSGDPVALHGSPGRVVQPSQVGAASRRLSRWENLRIDAVEDEAAPSGRVAGAFIRLDLRSERSHARPLRGRMLPGHPVLADGQQGPARATQGSHLRAASRRLGRPLGRPSPGDRYATEASHVPEGTWSLDQQGAGLDRPSVRMDSLRGAEPSVAGHVALGVQASGHLHRPGPEGQPVPANREATVAFATVFATA